MLNLIKTYFSKILFGFKEQQRLMNALSLADDLIATNDDFKHWSVEELANAILDDSQDVYLDKTTKIRLK